uniref:Uncharacterized protein n=1 Tax=Plectus sambesii TaxID=2011161 RepID=A0A914V0X7_9BILA
MTIGRETARQSRTLTGACAGHANGAAPYRSRAVGGALADSHQVCNSRADSIAGAFFVAVGRGSHDPRRDCHCLLAGLIVGVGEVARTRRFRASWDRRLYALRSTVRACFRLLLDRDGRRRCCVDVGALMVAAVGYPPTATAAAVVADNLIPRGSMDADRCARRRDPSTTSN